MQPLPSYDEFREEVGSVFVVAAIVDDASEELFELDLRLNAISELIVTPTARAWALEFRGPLDFTFEQGIASLDHARFGRLDLFLVPIGPTDGEMSYEAVFSLLSES